MDERLRSTNFQVELAGYAAFLVGTWRARDKLERLLDANNADQVYPDWPQRRIADLVRQDIHDIAGSELRVEHCSSIILRRLSDAQILGILYVLEGSALGARIMVKDFCRLGARPDFGARHIARQVEHPRAWASFLVLLENYPLSTVDEADCIESALATFAVFENAYVDAGLI